MIGEICSIIKDAAMVILIAVTLDRIKKGGDDRWPRIIFIAILFTL